MYYKQIQKLLLLALLNFNFTNVNLKEERKIISDNFYHLSIPDTNGKSIYLENREDINPRFKPKIPIEIDPTIRPPLELEKIPDIPFKYNVNFSKNYFKNLKTNMLSNLDGICGYTAIGMYLSYLDTFWNDNIISEEFDSNKSNYPYNKDSILSNANDFSNFESPGVINTIKSIKRLNEFITERLPSYNDNKYYSENEQKLIENGVLDYINAHINSKSFFGKLLELNIENKVIKPKTKFSDEPNYLTGIGVNFDIMVATLQNYINFKDLNKYITLKTGRLPDNKSNDESEIKKLRNEIIGHLKCGKVLIIGGESKENNSGHVWIAYDYNTSTDEIISNFGWNGVNSESNTNDFNIKDYYYFDFKSNFKHKHSDNYISNNGNICSCKLMSHQHNYICKYVNENQHKQLCYCLDGKYETVNHNFNQTTFIKGQEYAICGGCKYTKNIMGSGPIQGY